MLAFWVFVCLAIPTALLYPLALWAMKHTLISERTIGLAWSIGFALLFFPTAFAVDFLYRRFIRDRAKEPTTGVATL